MTSLESSTGVAGRTDLEARSKDDNRAMRQGSRRRGARNAVSAPSPRGITSINICQLEITDTISGQANRYKAKVYGGNIDVAATGNLAKADLGTAGDNDEVEYWHTPAAGESENQLEVGDIVQGTYADFNPSTSKPIFITAGGGGDRFPPPTALYQVWSVTAFTADPLAYTLAWDWPRANAGSLYEE